MNNHRVRYGRMAVICATTNPMRITLCVSPDYPNPSPSNLLHWLASASARGHRTLSNPTLTILERFHSFDPALDRPRAEERLAWHRAHPPRHMNRRLAAPGTPASRSPYPVTTASPWTVFYTLPAAPEPQPPRLRAKTSPALANARAAAAWFLALHPEARIHDVVPGPTKGPQAVARRAQLQQLMSPTYGGYKRLMGL